MARSTSPADNAGRADESTEPPSEDHRIAAEKRAKASGGVTDSERKRLDIDALLAERRGYVQRGLDDRVSAVDEALAARGYKVPTPGASRGSSAASGA